MTAFIVFTFVLYYALMASRKNVMDKPSYRVLLLFSIYWFVSLFLSTIGIYGLKTPGFYSISMLVILVISFSFGFCLRKIDNTSSLFNEKLAVEIQYSQQNKLYKLLLVLGCLYVYTKLIVFKDLVALYGNSGIIRSTLSGGGLDEAVYGSDFPYINFFLVLLFIYISPSFAYNCIYRRNIWCILEGLFLIGHSIITVSRFGFLRFLFAFILLVYVYNIGYFSKKKILLWCLGSLMLLFVAVSISSGARTGTLSSNISEGMEDARKDMITYSCGPVVAFDYAVEHNYISRVGGYQLGTLTFSSVDLLLKTTIGRIVPYTAALERFAFKQEDIIEVGRNYQWNALYTAAIYFYLDFGVIGVILFPFLLGVLFRYCILCLYNKPTYAMLVLVFAFFRGAIFSVVDYDYTSAFCCIFFLYLYRQWYKR